MATADRGITGVDARRAYLAGMAAIVVVGAVFSQRSADPTLADPAASVALRGQLAEQVATARAALATLRKEIGTAVDAGRRGAALTVSGTELPGSYLDSAGARLAAAEGLLARALGAVRAVDGSLAIAAAARAGQGPRQVTLVLGTGQLAATGAQLRAAGPAADAFVAMRRATDGALTGLSAALAALDARDPSGALAALDSADGQLAVVRAWPGQLETLPIWIDTTTALVAALRSLARASLAHDVEAIREAQRAYQAAADDGEQADRALAIAIAEGGSAISSGAMRSAADELAAVDDALAELASAS